MSPGMTDLVPIPDLTAFPERIEFDQTSFFILEREPIENRVQIMKDVTDQIVATAKSLGALKVECFREPGATGLGFVMVYEFKWPRVMSVEDWARENAEGTVA